MIKIGNKISERQLKSCFTVYIRVLDLQKSYTCDL